VRGRVVVLAVVFTAVLAGGCASTPKEPPKRVTESDVRARFTAERSEQALAKVEDATIRNVMRRQLAERSRAALARGARVAIEAVRVGEKMGIGQGMNLERVFALYHEYDATTFTTYLEGVELIGGALRTAMRQPVGGTGKGFAELFEVELNRAVLDVYFFKDGDPDCCPSETGRTAYYLTGFGLESAQ
jgi:hypothetical protein